MSKLNLFPNSRSNVELPVFVNNLLTLRVNKYPTID